MQYVRIRERARQIAARFPAPEFYADFPLENAFSQRFFERDPIVRTIRGVAAAELEDDFGHGLLHADKVSLDAGALVIIECRHAGYPLERIRRRLRLAHCAGLLHDVRRKDADHAAAGHAFAQNYLVRSALFPPSDAEAVSRAILNHEAFKKNVRITGAKGQMISACLYDADKFRWGSDNFTDTVWDMVSFLQVPLEKFIARYPAGLAGIARIKKTFRTATGKLYGPRFIDTGLAVGRELYQSLLRDVTLS